MRTIVTLLALALSSPALAGGPGRELVSGKPFGGKWVLILGSHTNSTDVPEGLAKLSKHPELMKSVARIASSEFKNLMPCYQVVIAGAFDTKAQARKRWKKLKAIGVKSYFKNAGKWVGAQPKVEAYCARKAKGPDTGGCGTLRWVERWGKDAQRRFLMLPVDEVVLDRLTAKAAAPRMLDGDVTVWRTGLANDVAGGVRKGDAFDLYAVDKAAKQATCKVSGFSLLTRGQPHFGWIQMAEQKKPERPGCGSPVLFAELRCEKDPGFVELAVAAGTQGPRILEPMPLSDDQKRRLTQVLKRVPSFEKLRAKAEAEAAKRGQPLREQISLDGFKSGDISVAVVSLVWMTGDGMVECGGDDLRLEYKGIGGWKPGGKISVVVPFQERDQTTVRGLLYEPEGNTFKLIEQVFPSTTRIEPLGRDGNTCEIGLDFCDCPC